MKKWKLLLYLLLPASALTAQTPPALSHWFYGLPLNKGAKAIVKKIESDNRFVIPPETDTTAGAGLLVRAINGKIVKTNLPDGFNTPDSATIELTSGAISNVGVPEASGNYSGWLKIVRIEYFYADSALINNLFLKACRELRKKDKKEVFVRVGTPGKTNDGTGQEFEYINNRQHLKSLTLLKNKTLTGARSLLLEYQANGEMDVLPIKLKF